MSDLRKAAEMALEAFDYHFDNEDDYLNWRYPLVLEAKQALRQALAMENFSEVNQELEEAIKAGTKAWADVPDATKWVDELRGEPEQEPVAPVDAVNISAERDDENAKAFYRLIRIMGTFDLATGHADSWDELLDSLESELRDVIGYYRQALAEESLQHMTTNAEELGLYDLELIGKSYEALRCDVDALKDKP
jgi:AcrR family transcriptional regulator